MPTEPRAAASHHSTLASIAHRCMLERGLAPEYPAEALRQLAAITEAAALGDAKDLTALLWCSVDNDDSRDLNQLTVGETLPSGETRILVAVADVDAVVGKGSPLDAHAGLNTTSVYTAGGIFAMLPERLSTDLTSLGENEARVAMVMDYVVDANGEVAKESVYRAAVKNWAKLAYDATAAWLDGNGPIPKPIARVPGMQEQLRLQDAAAQRLRAHRHASGALEFQTLAPRAVMEGDRVVRLAADLRNRAKDLIEEFMVAANGVTARFLKSHQIPSMRRVVRSPQRWDRIVIYAQKLGETLPAVADAKALEQFLVKRRTADPLRFPDVSLDIVKMMGRGEYVVEMPGETPIGHFGLAVRDYTHSTAPNRRFPDLVTHRLLKQAMGLPTQAYGRDELFGLARHCTDQEDNADRVERQVRKSAAALLLESRIGDCFDAIVTGVSDKGTWVRVFDPPVEGKLVHGKEHLDIADRCKVKLIGVNVDQGFIDFVRV